MSELTVRTTEKHFKGMRYLEMIYGDAPDEGQLPTVVVLHWMTGAAEQMTFLFEQLDFPIRAICPDGRYPSGREKGGRSWYPDGPAFYDDRSLAEQVPDVSRVTGEIADFLRHLVAELGGKVAVTGASQGGDLSLMLAVHHPDTLDLALPVAGRLPAEFRAGAPVGDAAVWPRVAVYQGQDDPIVSVESARELHAWLAAQGYDSQLKVYADCAHEIPDEMAAHILARVRELAE